MSTKSGSKVLDLVGCPLGYVPHFVRRGCDKTRVGCVFAHLLFTPSPPVSRHDPCVLLQLRVWERRRRSVLQSERASGDWMRLPPGHLITGAEREEVMGK